MVSLAELKAGMLIEHRSRPAKILKCEHFKLARGGAILKTKLEFLDDGSIIDRTFKGEEKIDQVILERRKAQFLYHDGADFWFMDSESFEQFSLNKKVLGEKIEYLKDGLKLDIYYYSDNPINLNLPIKMDFKVTEADPNIRGNTASSPTKKAIIETGKTILVPLFIKAGDKILIDTRSGKYLERVKN